LGKFNLDNLPPARRGEPRIEVTYIVDENSVLTVKATVELSGKKIEG